MPADLSRLRAAVAAHGLPGAPTDVWPDVPLDTTTWDALGASVVGARIPGFLARTIADGALPTTSTQAAEAKTWHTAALALVAALEGVLAEVVLRLRHDGIEVRVLKGPAVARLDYPEARARTFGDIDLLVRGDDFDGAVASLTRAGFRRRTHELRPGFDRRFGKGVPLTRGRGVEIDLHRTFADGPYGLRSRPDDLFADPVAITVGGIEMSALSRDSRLLHACYHAALSGHLRMSSVRDVAQLLLVSDADGAVVRAHARAWGGEAVVARAVARTWRMLTLPNEGPFTEWAAGYTFDRRDVRDLAASVGEGAGWQHQALEGFFSVRGWERRAAYAGALLWPSASFMATRPGGRLVRLGRAVGRIPTWLQMGPPLRRSGS